MNAHEEMMKAYSILEAASRLMIEEWLKYTLFTWRWWVQLFLTVVPWLLWLKFRKKESCDRLMYAGFSVIIYASAMDTIGVLYGLWAYKWKLVPFPPSFIPWDFSLIPVAAMFMLQYNPFKLNRYIKAAIFSAGASFLVEPLFVLMDFYVPLNWKHIYSFPLTMIMYLIADWLSRREKFEPI